VTDPALIKKLQIKPGMRLLVLNAPADYRARLGDLEVDAVPGEGKHDFVQVFAANSAELSPVSAAGAGAIKYDGILWVTYPKLSGKVKSDLSRERVWELVAPLGLRPVAQVSIDDTWSALRFRPSTGTDR
jgi:hypothetical protein